MAKFPAMPLWTDAYLADCGHLDDAETGRYLLMLIYLWRAPRQRFPNDDDWLARKFRRSVSDVQTQIRPLVKEFCSTDGNWIWQGRVKKEFSYLLAKSESQSVRAKARWSKEKEVCRDDGCLAYAPTPTPTPIKREGKPSPKKGSRLDSTWTLPQPWGAWALKEGLSDSQVRNQSAIFHDYWIGVPGQKGVKLDWRATWRNWIRNSAARGSFTNGGPSTRPEPMTASDHIMADAKRRAAG